MRQQETDRERLEAWVGKLHDDGAPGAATLTYSTSHGDGGTIWHARVQEGDRIRLDIEGLGITPEAACGSAIRSIEELGWNVP